MIFNEVIGSCRVNRRLLLLIRFNAWQLNCFAPWHNQGRVSLNCHRQRLLILIRFNARQLNCFAPSPQGRVSLNCHRRRLLILIRFNALQLNCFAPGPQGRVSLNCHRWIKIAQILNITLKVLHVSLLVLGSVVFILRLTSFGIPTHIYTKYQ